MSGSSQSEFRIGAELGRGGMGSVRVATDERLGRELAIKSLHESDSSAAARFIEEAQITSQLQHPYIVPIYQLGEDPLGRPWIAMKRVEGRSLADAIADWSRRPTLTPADIDRSLDIFRKVCDAVAFAHSRGVIHRDLKPANVMIGDWGEVLVLDWGIAKPLGGASPDGHDADVMVHSDRRMSGDDHTVQGDVIGTPAFMPPEQAAGRVDEVDERADIFALGGILYSMLTGHSPYDGDSSLQIIAAAYQRRLDSPRKRTPHRGIPSELDAIVMKAMARDRDDRYQRVEEIVADVVAYRANLPVSARRDPFVTRVAKWVKRNPVTAASSGLTVMFLAVVAGLAGVWVARLAESERVATESQRQAEAAQRAREDAEHAAFRERLRALAEEQKFDELSAAVGAEIARRRDTARAEFIASLADRPPGVSPREFFRSLRSKTDMDAVIAAFEEAVKPSNMDRVYCDDDDFLCLGMLHHYATGDASRAIQCFNRAIELNNENTRALLERGLLCVHMKRLGAGRKDFERALEIEPDNADAYAMLGESWLGEDNEKAVDLFRRAARMDPEDPAKVEGIGRALATASRIVEAEAIFREMMDRWPGYPDGHLGLATVFLENQVHLDEVPGLLDRVLELSPMHSVGRGQRGLYRYATGDLPGAIEDLEMAVRIAPESIMPWIYLGHARRRVGQADAALEAYDRALEIDPGEFEVAYHAAMLLMPRQSIPDVNRALRYLDLAVDAQPQNLEIRIHRGNARFFVGNRPGALDDLHAALRIDPRSFDVWLGLGMVYRAMGNRDDAIRALRKALEVAPPNHHQVPYARQALRELGG